MLTSTFQLDGKTYVKFFPNAETLSILTIKMRASLMDMCLVRSNSYVDGGLRFQALEFAYGCRIDSSRDSE